MDEKELVVENAYPNDAGRGIARLDPSILEALELMTGDIIEIEGKKRTSARVWHNAKDDWNKDIILIDGFIRENAGVVIGECVKVRKADVKIAKRVVLKPSWEIPPQFRVRDDSDDMIKRQIIRRTISKGDIITVMNHRDKRILHGVTGTAIPLTAVETEPEGVLLITDKTEIVYDDTNQIESHIYSLLGFNKIEMDGEYSHDELYEILGERRFMLLTKLYSILDKVLYPDKKLHTQRKLRENNEG